MIVVAADDKELKPTAWDNFLRDLPKIPSDEPSAVAQFHNNVWHIQLPAGLHFLSKLTARADICGIMLHVLFLKKSPTDWVTFKPSGK